MDYADDVTILAKTKREMNSAILALNEWCLRNRMQVNASKTKIFKFRTKGGWRADERTGFLLTGGAWRRCTRRPS